MRRPCARSALPDVEVTTPTVPKRSSKPRVSRPESQRRDAVALLESRGSRSVAQIAVEVGCAPAQLYMWRRLYGSGPAEAQPVESADAELKRVRLELTKVTKERDFLKKVSAFFAKSTA